MIRNVAFDLGGVLITLDYQRAVRAFQSLGLADAAQILDPYTQTDFFGDLELGRITAEDFIAELGRRAGRTLTFDECLQGWLGYVADVPQDKLNMLSDLRSKGYRVLILSNTNPFMMHWALSAQFDGQGHGLEHYADDIFMSYRLGVMKPNARFFTSVISQSGINPDETIFLDDGAANVAAAAEQGFHTLHVDNGGDWMPALRAQLEELG